MVFLFFILCHLHINNKKYIKEKRNFKDEWFFTCDTNSGFKEQTKCCKKNLYWKALFISSSFPPSGVFFSFIYFYIYVFLFFRAINSKSQMCYIILFSAYPSRNTIGKMIGKEWNKQRHKIEGKSPQFNIYEIKGNKIQWWGYCVSTWYKIYIYNMSKCVSCIS